MIIHLKILSLVIILIVGTYVIIRIYQVFKEYRFPYLLSLFKYTLLINIAFGILLFGLYIEENLPSDFYSTLLEKYQFILDLTISLLVTGMIYYMIEILLAFRDIEISNLAKRLVLALMFLLIISYLLRIMYPSSEPYLSWLDFLRYRIFENLIILEFIILLLSLFNWGNRIHKNAFRICWVFSALYLLRYAVSFLFAYIFSKYIFLETNKFLIGFAILMIYNLFPLLWLNYFFLQYVDKFLLQERGAIDLDRILEKYNISKREIEVIGLILEGKSNEEIREALFISFHTVKNHISNIFKKLNVKSRYELIYFLTKNRY